MQLNYQQRQQVYDAAVDFIKGKYNLTELASSTLLRCRNKDGESLSYVGNFLSTKVRAPPSANVLLRRGLIKTPTHRNLSITVEWHAVLTEKGKQAILDFENKREELTQNV